MKTLRDFDNKNRQLGKLEFLPNKTYYKENLKHEGIYFFTNLQLIMKKDFYFEPGTSGFVSLTSDDKLNLLTEEKARQCIES